MQRLEVLGFWFSPFAPSTLPRPQALVGTWRPAVREAVLRYLRAGKVLVRYPEPSFCRFDCGEPAMGKSDCTDGRFVWPEGLAHYVEHHDVQLPESFVAHVVAAEGEVAPFRLPKATFGLYDRGPWLAWSRTQRACPDLEGFELPDDEIKARIAEDLAGVAYDEILVCRGSTREVVLAVAGGLELRQVRAGGRAPQRFAGWHEWPVVGEVAAAVDAPPAKPGKGNANAAAAAALAGLRKPKPASGQSFADFFAARRPRDDDAGSGRPGGSSA